MLFFPLLFTDINLFLCVCCIYVVCSLWLLLFLMLLLYIFFCIWPLSFTFILSHFVVCVSYAPFYFCVVCFKGVSINSRTLCELLYHHNNQARKVFVCAAVKNLLRLKAIREKTGHTCTAHIKYTHFRLDAHT